MDSNNLGACSHSSQPLDINMMELSLTVGISAVHYLLLLTMKPLLTTIKLDSYILLDLTWMTTDCKQA